jgi:hypothetical protein
MALAVPGQRAYRPAGHGAGPARPAPPRRARRTVSTGWPPRCAR